MEKAKLVGINHVALEVGDVEQALEFYSKIFNFTLRSKTQNHAFIDLGDQFIALMKSSSSHEDKIRHFGLVVDDASQVKELAKKAGAELIGGRFLDFRDPWGNYIQIIEYADIQFTKTAEVLAGMNPHLQKNQTVLKELAEKGMAPRH